MGEYVDPSALRQQIKEAARLLFQMQGYDQTTLKDVCDYLSINEQMLGTFFGTKDDLLEAVWSEC